MNTEKQKRKCKKTLMVLAALLGLTLLIACCGVREPVSQGKDESIPIPTAPPKILIWIVVTATPEPTVEPIPPHIPTPTSPPTPTWVVVTATPVPPSAVPIAQPTQSPPTLIPTELPQPTAVPPTSPPQPTTAPTEPPPPTEVPPPPPVCDCSYNRYNCADFGTHRRAQACFNYCWSIGAGDVHRLDRDDDGSACEALP